MPNQTMFCYIRIFFLTRTEQLLAESFVVVGSRHFSALVIHVRIHTIDTEVSLLLGEWLQEDEIQDQLRRQEGKE